MTDAEPTVVTKAQALATELVGIATTGEYEDLRDDMLREVLTREFLGRTQDDFENLVVASATITLLVGLIREFYDRGRL